MNAENALQVAVENPDFLCEAGSRLYGTSTPESDHDLRGFAFTPFEYLIGVNQFKMRDLGDDHKIFSVWRFLDLAMGGDPLLTEILFAPEDKIVKCTELGKGILELRDDIISNVSFRRIMGYSNSEWRKTIGCKIESKENKKDKDNVLNDIRNLFKPNKEQMDTIVGVLDQLDEKIMVPSFSGMGEKRKADMAKYGYCRKNAVHSIRLVKQVTELMKTATLTFPRPEAELLMSIRNGELTKDEVQAVYDDARTQAEEQRENSSLPDKPNRVKIHKYYTLMVADILNGDERFEELLENGSV
jgi:hypothetical protein